MKNTRWLFILICLLGSLYAKAQQTTKDVIYLKDGTAYWGSIVTEEAGRRVFIRLSGGDIIVVKHENIEKIEKGVISPVSDASISAEADNKHQKAAKKRQPGQSTPAGKKTYAFKEKGLYSATSLGANFADGGIENVVGLGFHHSSGYQINRMIGVGLGFGLDAYSLNRSEMVLPVFAEARGYLSKKKIAPYYALSTGYGFALRNVSQSITEARGGWMIHPAIGIRLGADKGLNTTLDLGYRFQEASFVRTFLFNGETEVRDVTYRRLMLRMGILF